MGNVRQWVSRLRHDSRAQRHALLVSGAALILVALPATALLAALALSSGASASDRLAETGDILAGATLLLAFIAALVAMLAYAVATGSPDLKLQVHFEFSYINRPVFDAEVQEGGRLRAKQFKQTLGTISLRNDSGYPARNPAVIVRLRGMVFLFREDSPSRTYWVITEFSNTNGILAVQWDGGPTYSIHGRSTRLLPMLDMT